MPQFDVLHEGWIPVENLDGSFELVGMLTVLERAHQIRQIKAASPLVTYGIQRTLIALLTDIFRPVDIDALAELIEMGKIDTVSLHAYFAKCKEEGTSFDLFDQDRPFMQTPMVELEDAKIVPANKLFLEIPEGNNHAHFVHKLETEHVFSPAECLQALCTLPAYATNFGTNAYFSINGMPPIYFLYDGLNLFETLTASMIALSAHPEMPLDKPPIVWRNFNRVEYGKKIAKISMLYGMTCQARCISLIPVEANGHITIKEMYYAKGWDFKNLPNWVDPHVAYVHDKDQIYTLKPKESKAVWRELGSIISPNSQPKIINQIGEKIEHGDYCAKLSSYSLFGKFKGPVYAVGGWYEESLSIDLRIMGDERKAKLLISMLEIVEGIGKVINRVLKKSIQQLHGKKGAKNERSRYANLVEQALTLYFASVRAYVFGDFTSRVAGLDSSHIDWDLGIKNEIGDKLNLFAIDAFTSIIEKLGSSAKALEWKAVAETQLRQGVYGALKKGGWRDG